MNLTEKMDEEENTLDKVCFGCLSINVALADNVVKPLVSTSVPLSVIRAEYVNGSQQIVKKLDYLQENGWDQVWRARGDGDCFYRCRSTANLLFK